jgi:hypothetical protein
MNEPRVDIQKGKIIQPIDYKKASSMLEFRENKKKVKAMKKGVVYRDNVISEQLKSNENEFNNIKKEREEHRQKQDALAAKQFQERINKEKREYIVTLENAGQSVLLEKKKKK